MNFIEENIENLLKQKFSSLEQLEVQSKKQYNSLRKINEKFNELEPLKLIKKKLEKINFTQKSEPIKNNTPKRNSIIGIGTVSAKINSNKLASKNNINNDKKNDNSKKEEISKRFDKIELNKNTFKKNKPEVSYKKTTSIKTKETDNTKKIIKSNKNIKNEKEHENIDDDSKINQKKNENEKKKSISKNLEKLPSKEIKNLKSEENVKKLNSSTRLIEKRNAIKNNRKDAISMKKISVPQKTQNTKNEENNKNKNKKKDTQSKILERDNKSKTDPSRNLKASLLTKAKNNSKNKNEKISSKKSLNSKNNTESNKSIKNEKKEDDKFEKEIEKKNKEDEKCEKEQNFYKIESDSKNDEKEQNLEENLMDKNIEDEDKEGEDQNKGELEEIGEILNNGSKQSIDDSSEMSLLSEQKEQGENNKILAEKKRRSTFFKNLLFNCQCDKIDLTYDSTLNFSEQIDDLTKNTNLSNQDKMFFYEIMEENEDLSSLDISFERNEISKKKTNNTYESFLQFNHRKDHYFLNKKFSHIVCADLIRKIQKEIKKIEYKKLSYVRDFGIIPINNEVVFKLSFFSNFYLNHIENEYLKMRDNFEKNPHLDNYMKIFSMIDNISYETDMEGVPAVIRRLKNFAPAALHIQNKIKIENIYKNNPLIFDTNQAFKFNQLTGYFCHILRDIVFFFGIICNRDYSLPENYNTIAFYKFLIEKKKYLHSFINRLNKIII